MITLADPCMEVLAMTAVPEHEADNPVSDVFTSSEMAWLSNFRPVIWDQVVDRSAKPLMFFPTS